ncbi:MAG: glycosyltransferase, partial [Patescibacteria group bacterium]
GPTASRNRGAKLALGEYTVFLDNDITVLPDSLERLVSFLDATKDAGMVGGKLLNERGEKIFWNMGLRINFVRQAIGKILYFFLQPFLVRSKRARDFLMNFSLNYWDYGRSIPVGWVIESFIAVRLELLRQVGGFDEQFFMFHEGPDLSERLRKIGYKTYFVHNAMVTMLEGHAHSPAKRKKMFRTSTWRYYRKHYFHF